MYINWNQNFMYIKSRLDITLHISRAAKLSALGLVNHYFGNPASKYIYIFLLTHGRQL